MEDVVIIGAGLSGLSAAKLLVEDYGLNVVVLEARDRVGGRTWTIKDKAFGYVDIGGSYFGPTQRRIFRLAKELGVDTYYVNQKEKSVLNVGGTFLKYHGTIPPVLNPIKGMDLNNAQQKLNKLASQVPVNAPWKAKKAKEWDSMTFKQFIDKTCWTGFAAEVMNLFCQAMFAVPSHEVSLLFALWHIACGQGLQRLTRITNGAQERKFVGGSMQLSAKMASRLGDRVKLNHPVISVQQLTDCVVVNCANGKTFKSHYVLSAMPQALLNQLTFDPPLDSLKMQLMQRMPMGSVIKTMMYYNTPFWKNKGLCGEMATDHGPIRYCVDDTKPDGSYPCIMGFIWANTAREMTDMTPDQRKEAIMKHYAEVFNDKAFLTPIHYVEKNWMEEEYSGGCFVSVMPPGVLTTYGHVLRAPHGRVHFAGTETATYWAGHMEGAVQAGERAAREILYRMKKVNKEDIDQEEPLLPDFPEPPVKELFVERILPSVTSFMWSLGVIGVGLLAWGVQQYVDLKLK